MKNEESIGCADECVKCEEKNEESIGCADECVKCEEKNEESIGCADECVKCEEKNEESIGCADECVKCEEKNEMENNECLDGKTKNSSFFILHSSLKKIKQSFRLLMNGVASQSMREKGAETGYHLNWGASLPHLQEMAKEIGKDYDLAIALWKENVRECKILATMVMPAEKMLPEVVDIWMEQTMGQEIAEMASFNLYQHLPFAAEKAYRWMASDKPLYQLCGFLVIARLFMKGQVPNERGINEFVDQAITAMQDGEMMVRKAAMQSLLRFADLGLVYERIAQSAAKKANLDIF